jgi:hypothetical protein
MSIPLIDDIRRHHALEHATVTLLLARRGSPGKMLGRASVDGFWLISPFSPDDVRPAAQEALRRLKAGEAELAVSPLCGTNIAVAGALAGIGAMLAAGRRRNVDSIGNAISAAMAGIVLGQPVGRWVQQRITTLPDLVDVEIISVRGTRLRGSHAVKVKTRRGVQGYLEMEA